MKTAIGLNGKPTGKSLLRHDTITRDVLAEVIRGAVDDTVRMQMRRRAQEPQITSKVASEIERRLDGDVITRYRVSVVAQDFADRGPGSHEWHSGADLYLGIRVEHGDGFEVSKGMLIQAKKARTTLLRKNDGALLQQVVNEQIDLVEQCGKMLSRTKPNAAFVWLYDATGVEVVPAQELISNASTPPELLAKRNIAEQFREVLDCFQGDPDLVASSIFEDDGALGGFMEEMAVQRGIALKLSPVQS